MPNTKVEPEKEKYLMIRQGEGKSEPLVNKPVTESEAREFLKFLKHTGAVRSSLHQKLKLVTEGRLITINEEEDIIASVASNAPYIENDTEAIECSFRSLEFVNATFISEGGKIPARCQQRKEELERKREKRRARLNGAENEWGSMTFPHISNTFVSGGIIHSGLENMNKETDEDMMRALSINAVTEESPKKRNLEGISPYEPGSVLDNWTAKEILVVFRTKTESPDIDVMSDTAMGPKFPYEQDICLEGSQDFADDEDCSLSPDLLRMDLIKLLLEFKDVFAWSYQDMPGLSADIAVHRIPIKRECKPVQQKLRRMRPDVAVKITEEVKKQFDVGFLRVGTFCYQVMPFGLKNAGVTYQRAMVTLFHNMMHKEIEVYVDDMIAKSRTEREHVQLLRKLFLRLRKFQLKLNPAKCTFGARSGKLLGFIVSEKGIEVDLDKVKAVQELPPPRT
ncbi:reverse transcriptase [Gossypium australe]|uniref:Reverse transcriptase n=1 Tax=Gossypium australe TaxID=47621 RepID=A0A5B6W183_9ROSI|nr:reverse transcriptase [Gossypium australe]